MTITRANVEIYANKLGLDPVQIDEWPEGFSWRTPDITLGNRTYKGKIIKFKPLAEWADENSIIYE